MQRNDYNYEQRIISEALDRDYSEVADMSFGANVFPVSARQETCMPMHAFAIICMGGLILPPLFRYWSMNKRFFLSLLLALFSLAPCAFAAPPASLYVSPTGDDNNSGTDAAHPFKTIEKSRDTIRRETYNQNMQSDLVVHLRGGRYELDKTLTFDAQDSGSQGHSVIYQAYQKEEPKKNGTSPLATAFIGMFGFLFATLALTGIASLILERNKPKLS